jgi:hypothetical protein
MIPVDLLQKTIDPVEIFEGVIKCTWDTLCEAYDASGSLPEMRTLFEGADLSTPKQAAETVIVNMLMEISESISRFSPWYTKPARSFGIASIRDVKTNRLRWLLAPEAIQKWKEIIQPLAFAIRKNSGLIQAMILVDGLMDKNADVGPSIVAHCGCLPPRAIQIKRSILDQANIVCESCLQPFT